MSNTSSSDSAQPRRQEFEELFDATDDPWRLRDRWYEVRKRALMLACLPRSRYACGYEPACANGELSALLAQRCDRLLVSDGIARAVDLTSQRLAGVPHARAFRAWLPDDWPEGSFDLIVLSEFGYYLDAAALRQVAERAQGSLRPGGTIAACHWRPAIEGCTLDGDGVHRVMRDCLRLQRLVSHVEPDFRLDVWVEGAVSVAGAEGAENFSTRGV